VFENVLKNFMLSKMEAPYEFNLSPQRKNRSKDEKALKLSGNRIIVTGCAKPAGSSAL
jgi:hypothetical protein